jgi:hypothetical protein
MEPITMSLPPQWITKACGKPNQLTIACTKGTKAEIFIPGKPTHTTFKPFLSKPRFFPVGLWVVCFSAFAMIDDPIIHIFILNRPEIFHYDYSKPIKNYQMLM